MFESLSDRVQATFQKLAGKGRLSEADVKQALREVRLALLEADVNYRVVKDFAKRVGDRAVGEEVHKSLTPAQTVIKIVNEELVALLGEPVKLDMSSPLTVLMLVGLQGSGKTTMATKLALHLRKQGELPLLVAADTYRPAAIEQLETLGKQTGLTVHSEGSEALPANDLRECSATRQARGVHGGSAGYSGTPADRWPMMAELEDIRQVAAPQISFLWWMP